MPLLDRLSDQQLEDAVMDLLRKGREYEFPDLEQEVMAQYPEKIASRFDVRKAAWRLIGNNKAALGPGLKLRAK